MLFGIPGEKDPVGSQADAADGIVNVALQQLRADLGDELVLMADLCLCEYTDHGHCGVDHAGGRRRQRPDAGPLRGGGDRPGAGRGPRHRPQRDDGRPGRGDPPGPRRRRVHRDADPGLRRQVRVGLLRPVPRGGRGRAAVRRPLDLPDGPAQRRRGAARGGPGPRRGRRRRHGQAGAALPGHHHAGRRRGARAGERVPGQRRVRDGRGGRGQRLGRPRAGDPRDADRDPPRRCRHRADLLGGRGGPLLAAGDGAVRRARRVLAAVLAGRRRRSRSSWRSTSRCPAATSRPCSGWSRSSPSSASSAPARCPPAGSGPSGWTTTGLVRRPGAGPLAGHRRRPPARGRRRGRRRRAGARRRLVAAARAHRAAAQADRRPHRAGAHPGPGGAARRAVGLGETPDRPQVRRGHWAR